MASQFDEIDYLNQKMSGNKEEVVVEKTIPKNDLDYLNSKIGDTDTGEGLFAKMMKGLEKSMGGYSKGLRACGEGLTTMGKAGVELGVAGQAWVAGRVAGVGTGQYNLTQALIDRRKAFPNEDHTAFLKTPEYKKLASGVADEARKMEEGVNKAATITPYWLGLQLQRKVGLLNEQQLQEKEAALVSQGVGGKDTAVIVDPVIHTIERALKPVHAFTKSQAGDDPWGEYVLETIGELIAFKAAHKGMQGVKHVTPIAAREVHGQLVKKASGLIQRFKDKGIKVETSALELAKKSPEEMATWVEKTLPEKKALVTTTPADLMSIVTEKEKLVTKEMARKEARQKRAEAAKAAEGETQTGMLPQELKGAKPRYSFGDRQFKLEFKDDVSRALYIVAKRDKLSKADPKYMEWLKKQGMTEEAIKTGSQLIRNHIKEKARTAEAGIEMLTIDMKEIGEIATARIVEAELAKPVEPLAEPLAEVAPIVEPLPAPVLPPVEVKPEVATLKVEPIAEVKAPEVVETKPEVSENFTKVEEPAVEVKAAEPKVIRKTAAERKAEREQRLQDAQTDKTVVAKAETVKEKQAASKALRDKMQAERIAAREAKKNAPPEPAVVEVKKKATPKKKPSEAFEEAKKRNIERQKKDIKLSKERDVETPVESMSRRKAVRALERDLGKKTVRKLMANERLSLVTKEKLREHLMDAGLTEGEMEGVRAFHDTNTGKSYVAYDGMLESSIYRETLHEVGVHAARLGFKEPAFQKILREIEVMSGESSRTGTAIQRAIARVPEDTNPKHFWEEVAARLLREKEPIAIKTRILNFFKGMFRKLGFEVGRLSVEDIRLFAEAATKRIARKELHELPLDMRLQMAANKEDAFKMSKDADEVSALMIRFQSPDNFLPALEKHFADKGLVKLTEDFSAHKPTDIKGWHPDHVKLLNDVVEEALAKGIGFEDLGVRKGIPTQALAKFATTCELYVKALMKELEVKEGKQVNPVWKNKEKTIANPPVYAKDIEALGDITEFVYKRPKDAILIPSESTFAEMSPRIYKLFREWPADAVVRVKREVEASVKQNKIVHDALSVAERKELDLLTFSMQKEGLTILQKKGIDPIMYADASPKVQLAYDFARAKLEAMWDRLNSTRILNGQEPFTKVENYFTISHKFEWLQENGFVSAMTEKATVEKMLKSKQVQEAFMEDRTNFVNKWGGDVVTEFDTFTRLSRYEKSGIRYIHETPVIAHLDALIEGKFFKREVIENGKPVMQKVGFQQMNQDAYNMMREYVNRIARGRVEYLGEKSPTFMGAEMDHIINTTMRVVNENMAASMLTGVKFFTSQVASVIPTFATAGRWTFVGLAKSLSPKENAFAMKNSRHLPMAINDAHMEALKSLAASVPSRYEKWRLTSKQASEQFAKLAIAVDFKQRQISWHSFRAKAQADGGKTIHMSPERYADSMVIKTQASGLLQDRAPIQSHIAGMTMTLFQTYVLSNYALLRYHIGRRGGLSKAGLQLSKQITAEGELSLKEHQKKFKTLAKELGIQTKNVTMTDAVMMTVAILAMNEAAGYLYEDMLNVRSPVPTPARTFLKSRENEDDLDVTTRKTVLDALGNAPLLGSAEFGKGIGGATYEVITNLVAPETTTEFVEAILNTSGVVPGYTGVVRPILKGFEAEEESLPYYFVIPVERGR